MHLAIYQVCCRNQRPRKTERDPTRTRYLSKELFTQHYPYTVRKLQGDAVTITCRYNTADRSKVTLGGYGIRDEMCITYMHYFPKTDLEVCKSSVDSFSLATYFDYMHM